MINKTVIITGAARGLGQKYALEFAKAGANIVFADINSCNDTENVIKPVTSNYLNLSLDVSNFDSCKNLAKKTMDKFNKILQTALVWRSRGDLVAIATVTETWGSSPRPVGSQMIINSKGEILGSVSGGCVEGAVIEEAMYCIKTGKSLSLSYHVNDEDAFAAKLTCGGSIKILIQSIDVCFSIDTLRTLVSKIDKNEAIGYVIDNINGENQLILTDNGHSESLENGSGFINNKFFVIYPLPLKMFFLIDKSDASLELITCNP